MTNQAGGRVAIVTGSSRGMGRAIAIALAQGGADVLINYRDDAAAAQSAADAIVEAGRRAHVVQANVGESAEVDRLVAACVSELGPPTILVNNAGIGKRVLDVADLDIDTWNDTIAINLTAPFLMTQAVVPYMRTAGWGRIINISSTAAQTGGSVGPHYAASKAGIIGLTHGYASKLVKEGITVNAIAMAQIETDMLRSATAADPSRIPIGRFGTVDEVAAVATMLVDNAYMTGQTISLNGGMYYTS
ncbi:SDR family NAD(P)-dependent oxidoreductase [Acidimicrobiaceae bacterium]|jgi:3-oxoacyl-[acyl-carrier protein] reductase|nr:SDR family NAD(P)-dependent oxidoreductase [Acidimicrobiaceae bacterium]MDB2392493.1 SDR family NAD(P)-dependent oxidoreductase [Acidimicrobiaceae bacterium]MDG1087922.1 SDR family NAD(P)-dependent oxidoreductase [Acidimicrobiales bacterium]